MKKIYLLLVLALVFCLMATACGGSGKKTAPATETNANSSGTTDTSPMGKYEPGITMSFAMPFDESSEATALLKKTFNETLSDNRWTKYFKDTLGITLQYKLVAASGDPYNQKFKLAMASGDLPDYFRITQLSDLKNLVDAGKVAELGPVYEKYASPLLRKITEGEGKKVFDIVTYNGKIYGLPLKGTSTDSYNHLWIRQDWLDKLGLQRPKTIDDVMNIATAFTNNDPDGNGKKDTFGMLLTKDFLFQSSGIFWGYGAYPNNPPQWIKNSDGKLVYSTVQPEMKKGLEFLRNMFQQGLLDKEFATKDFNKAFEFAVNGKIGMFYGHHWDAWAIDNVVKKDPKAKWIAVPLPTSDGSPVKVPITISTMGIEAASANADHPEALIKLANSYVEKLFGENKDAESAKFFVDGGYEFWNLAPMAILDPMVDLQSHREIKKAIADGTTDQLQGSAKDYYHFMQQGVLPWTLMFGPKDTPFTFVDASYPQQVIWNEFNSAPTTTMAARWSNMEELINTTFVKIINGQLDLDSGFDNMVDQWNKLGGDKVTQEVNDVMKK